MPGPRSKRKRAEIDSTAVAPAPPRRRGRDAASGAEPPAKSNKNENESDNNKSVAQEMEPKLAAENQATNSTEASAKLDESSSKKEGSEGNDHAQDGPTSKSNMTVDTGEGSEGQKDNSEKEKAANSNGANASESVEDSGTSSGDRVARIQGLLKHRKILLERLRHGRTAAQRRLDLVIKENPSKKSQTADEEIAAFQAMSKKATSLARKQVRTESESTSEKRTSVSLRRGSSVGKRMNAALSSLAPGTSLPATAVDAVQAQPAPLPSKAASQAAGVPSAGAPIPPPVSTVRPGVPPAKRVLPQASPSASLHRAIGQRKAPASTSARASSSTMGGTSGPLHAGLSGSRLPPNRLAQPSVICPEAMSLRERRNAIRGNLISLIGSRKRRIEEIKRQQSGKGESNFASMGSPSSPGHPQSLSSHLSRAERIAAFRGPEPPPHLPRRRKTHWDSLLEEMRWMATDFIEERKWKMSSARTLGESFLSKDKKKATLSGKPKDVDHGEQAKSTVQKSTESGSDLETATSSKDDATMKKQDGIDTEHRAYNEVCPEDEAEARKAASLMSSMVSELIQISADVGSFMKPDQAYSIALRRYQLTRKRLRGDLSLATPDGTAAEEAVGTSNGERGVSGDKETSNGSDKEEKKVIVDAADHMPYGQAEKEEAYQRITDHVETLLAKKSKTGAKTKSFTGSGKDIDTDIELSAGQTKVVDTVEDQWTRVEAGAVLHGPSSSGKTIAACALLWRHRGDGPQLVVCSSSSMIKWIHEVGRFKGLRRRSVGLAVGFSSPVLDCRTDLNFTAHDVVLCEYSALSRLLSQMSKFRLIIVDCRYPNGFCGSRLPVCAEDDKDPLAQSSRNFSSVPPELRSRTWWAALIGAVADSRTKRLLIDTASPNESLRALKGLQDREILDVLALRVALLMGAAAMRSSQHTIQKNLLAWARQRIKSSEVEGSKFERVKRLFVDLMEPLYCHVDGAKLLEDISPSRPNSSCWEVRKCEMSTFQRSAYEKSCEEVRTLLSESLLQSKNSFRMKIDPLSAACDALLCLRRQCVHANLRATLLHPRVRSRFGSFSIADSTGLGIRPLVLSRKSRDSPSQPDLDLAGSILEGSCKMRELLTILMKDIEINFNGKESLEPFLSEDGRKTSTKSKTKRMTPDSFRKVAVLAVLPEMQLLVSILLNSIGINHDLLLRSVSSSSEKDDVESESQKGALAWNECQLILSRFNEASSESSQDRIIVASPITVAGDHGGLGIEQADFVICVDEDWSGRGELILKSVLSRCLACRGDGCRLVKIVAEDTCEDSFLSLGGKNEGRRKSRQKRTQSTGTWPWPPSAFGTFVARPSLPSREVDAVEESWASRKASTDSFAFPGCNLFELSDKDLSDVLATSEPLPPLFPLSSDLVFLPSADDGSRLQIEMDLIKRLLEKEELASPLFRRLRQENETAQQFVSILPPLQIDSPMNLPVRKDLPVLSTRYFLERLGKAVALKEFGDNAEVATLALPREQAQADGALQSRDSNVDETSDLWQNFDLDKPQCEVVTSLLFYPSFEASVDNKTRAVDQAASAFPSNIHYGWDPSSDSMERRRNFYCSSFCGSKEKAGPQDGSQGAEALVYFPPMFPRMLECSKLAKSDVQALRGRRKSDAAVASKRPAVPTGIENAKRQRLDQDPKLVATTDATASAQVQAQEKPTSDRRVITEDEASHSDAASVLLDLTDDYGLAGIGAVPLPRDSALTAGQTVNDGTKTRRLDQGSADDWVSLLAPGNPEEVETSRQADIESLILFVSRKRPRGFAGLPSPPHTHRFHQGISVGGVPWAGAQGASSASVPSQGVGNGLIYDVNGTGPGKKLKKKVPGQKDSTAVGPSAFNRLPMELQQAARPNVHMQAPMQLPKTKDMYRSRLLAALRQSGFGTTLFEAPSFRVAAVRVRNRVGERLAQQCWKSSSAFEAGPGLPLLVSKQNSTTPGYGLLEPDPHVWTSIVKRLKNRNSATGDEAIELSLAQRKAFRRSLVAPCRVDFGPFQSGFLASASGMTAVTPPRNRAGISLPMGVKIPQTGREHDFPWNNTEDEMLQRCAIRFGMNWHLAARILSGFQDMAFFSKPSSGSRRPPRAARSCREHWQSLARANPSLAKDVRQSEISQREDALLSYGSIVAGNETGQRVADTNDESDDKVSLRASATKHPLIYLLPKSKDGGSDGVRKELKGEQEDENLKKADSTAGNTGGKLDHGEPDVDAMGAVSSSKVQEATQAKRSFKALLAAKSKKQVTPMTIPGVVSGSPPSVVPSHPSHMQSVQSSVAASWTSGRTDMWPLQLLDAADRQRATVAAAASSTASHAPSNCSRAHGSTSSTPSGARPSSSGAQPSAHRSVSAPSVPQRPPTNPFPSAPPTNNRSHPTAATRQSFVPPPKQPSAPPGPKASEKEQGGQSGPSKG